MPPPPGASPQALLKREGSGRRCLNPPHSAPGAQQRARPADAREPSSSVRRPLWREYSAKGSFKEAREAPAVGQERSASLEAAPVAPPYVVGQRSASMDNAPMAEGSFDDEDLANNIKELQIILSGLAKGMSSVSYIGLLMFLLFYVFGIVALMFFRCEPPPFRGVRQPTGTDITRLPQTKRPRALPGPARDDGHALPLRHNGRLDRCDVRLDVRMPHVPLRQRRGPAQVREFGRLWPVRRDMYVPTTCCFKMALGSRFFVPLQSGSCSSCCRHW